MLQDSPSPSSGDALEIPPQDSLPLASRRKRPLESVQVAQNGTGKPPAKRERKDTTTTEPPLHHVARVAWDVLKKNAPHRSDFRKDEIVPAFTDECHRLRLSSKVIQRLKRQLSKFITRVGMFQKSPRHDAPPDSYVMLNPDYKHVRSREPQRKSETGKKGESASGGSNAGDDVVMQEVPSRATVPAEWTMEAFKPVRLSPFDKSHAITFVRENTVKGYKGYRMIRATNGVTEGDWYFECTIMPYEDGAVRLGWSMRRCDVETPVGFDAYGFGLRDRSGEFVHMARRKPYGEPFTVGDVIGCRIVLPNLTDEEKKEVTDAEERALQYRFVSYGQGPAPADSGIDITWRAKIEFFKNGKSMGTPSLFNAPKPPLASATDEKVRIASQNGHKKTTESPIPSSQTEGEVKKCMKAGVYYPSVALYRDAVVQANFGPDFKYTLPEGSRPLWEAAREKPIDPVPEPVPLDKVEANDAAPHKPEENSPAVSETLKQSTDEARQSSEDGKSVSAMPTARETPEGSELDGKQKATVAGQSDQAVESAKEKQGNRVENTEQPDNMCQTTEGALQGKKDIANSGSGSDVPAVDKMPVPVSQ